MSKSSIFCVTLVAIMGILIPVCLPVFAQTVGPANPNANITTAYQLLHGNQTGGLTVIPPLSVQTDLPTYKQGDGVIITGHVKNLENGTALTLRVFSSLKNLISVAQFLPTSDGSFTKTFLATGPLWKDAGNYTVIAQYGRYTTVNATFYYAGGNGGTIVNSFLNATYQLQSGGQTYNIPYIIKGGSVKSMDILAEKFTLEITINAQSDGSITITLPRAMIDAKIAANLTKDQIMTGEKVNPNDLEDGNFIVTAGNNLVTFAETKNPQVRILSIPFHTGDTKIDIVGTIIVPEFGTIAALVLAIAIISIIAVSAKTGLRLMPKY